MPPPFLVDIPFSQIINTVIALGVPGGAIWYVRDRKKDKAVAQITETQADVAESTRDVDISAKGLEFVGRAIEMERQSFENERASLLRQVEDCTKSLKQIQEAYKLETERMHEHIGACRERTQKALTEADMVRGQMTFLNAQLATRPIPIIVESGRAVNDFGDSDQSGS
jgi:chromosome segregation ATPase